MSSNVPCPEQRCGVQSHVGGSRAAQNCSAYSSHQSSVLEKLKGAPPISAAAYTAENEYGVMDRDDTNLRSLSEQLDADWSADHEGNMTLFTGNEALDKDRGPILFVYGGADDEGSYDGDKHWISNSPYIILQRSNEFGEEEFFSASQEEPPVGKFNEDGNIIFDARDSDNIEDDVATLMNWASQKQIAHMEETGVIDKSQAPGYVAGWE